MGGIQGGLDLALLGLVTADVFNPSLRLSLLICYITSTTDERSYINQPLLETYLSPCPVQC